MAYEKLSRDANFEILVDICDGNMFKALQVARRYNRMKITISLKTIERKIIANLIKAGWSKEEIAKSVGVVPARLNEAIRRIENGKEE